MDITVEILRFQEVDLRFVAVRVVACYNGVEWAVCIFLGVSRNHGRAARVPLYGLDFFHGSGFFGLLLVRDFL